MKKSGKFIFVLLAISGLASLSVVAKHKQSIKKITIEQYENRLKEFCIIDIEEAKEEFYSFLNMGFNPTDAFDLTVIKRVYI